MVVSEGGRRNSQITLTEGLLKPTARKDFLEYTITHEWGHAIDRRDSERAFQAIQSIARSENTPMTKYGYRNGREAFAEAFAVKRLRSHEGGILSEDVPQDPKWERTFNILEIPSAISKATNQSGVSFFVADTFDPDNPPVLIENYTPPVKKHQEHDQKTHGSWAGGSSQSGLDTMPYEWKPKIKTPSDTSTEFEDFEYKKGKQYLEEAAISPTAIRVSGGDLNSIVSEGRFKTLEEQPDAPDFDSYKQARQELEVGLWGIPEKDAGPIYGYIDTPLQPSLDNQTRNYGEIKVILKDSVAGRTTITAGDSANSGLTPVLLKDIREGNLTNQQVDGAYRSRAFQSNEKTVFSPRIIVTQHTRIDYYEAQIHGGVSLKDIKSVDIRSQSGYSPPVSKNTIETLKNMGIEVIQND
jgi:hypothetical protein